MNITQALKWFLIALGSTLLAVALPWVITWSFPTMPDIWLEVKAGVVFSLGYVYKIFMNGHVNDPSPFETINMKEWIHGLLTALWGTLSAALTLWFTTGFPASTMEWLIQLGALLGTFITYALTTFFQLPPATVKK